MFERSESPPLPGMRRRFEGSCRAWSNGILLLVATAALAFFAWHMILDGTAAKDDDAFRASAEWVLLLLCGTLAFSLLPEARSAWQEGLKRQELPPARGSPCVRKRIFRTAGPAQPLFRHCAEELGEHFHRFYAFHRYQAPYVAYLYYAKKGSLSLLGLPWIKTGFLLLFLIGTPSVARGDFSDLLGWKSTILGAGCSLVIAGILIRAAVPYQKIWLRIVEENGRFCLTLSCCSRSKNRWFETFCRSIETQYGAVSCSTHAR